MRILAITEPTALNSNYRAAPLERLGERGHGVGFDISGATAFNPAYTQVDVLHIYRYHHDQIRRIARRAHDAGVAIVWDNDDDIVSMPSHRAGAMRSQRARSQMIEMIRCADVVTTTNQILAEQYEAWGAREVHVVANFIPDDFFREPRPSPGGRVVVGWTAAREHLDDFAALDLRATLLRLLDAHPEVVVESVGIDLGLPADRYRCHGFIPYAELADKVVGFDVGIAPIVDNVFNRARSDVKVKEYAAIGVPWLASPAGPYLGLGERQGGRLVADGDWYEQLERLVTRPRDRRKLGGRGRKWVRDHTVGARIGEWERAMNRACELARGRAKTQVST